MDTSRTNTRVRAPKRTVKGNAEKHTSNGKKHRKNKPARKERIDLRFNGEPVKSIAEAIAGSFGDPSGLPSPIISFAYDDQASIPDAYDSYLAYSFLKKYTPASDPKQRDARLARALDKWYAAERQCADTNARMSSSTFLFDLTPLQRRTLLRAKDLIRECLGETVSYGVLEDYRFGPGMSLSSGDGRNTTPYFKVSDLPITITRHAKPLALRLIARSASWWCALYTAATHTHVTEIPPYECRWRWLRANHATLFAETNASKLTFVPKDATTERPIAIEPAGNLPFQLSFDSYIRRRMRNCWGVELNSQSVNQVLASVGSYYHSWIQPCTIDLSSASDCMSTSLVQLLLPSEWFAVLSDFRCEYSFGKDLPSPVHLNKFSSMGNGFTFALESLIFYAISRAATQVAGSDTRLCHIHGDDIVVPRASALLCVEMLQVCGFSLNSEKTFLTGNFRESCGHDYLQGVNIRPPMVKGDITDSIDILKALNGLRNKELSCESRLSLALYERLLDHLPAFFRRLLGPSNGDDGHLHSAPHLYLALCRIDENRTPWYLSVTDVPIDWTRRLRRETTYNQWAHYASTLYSIGSDGFGSAITRRKSVRTSLKPKPVLGTSLQFEEKRSFDRILERWLRGSDCNA